MGIENNIPVGWTKTTLGDVCENISRRFNFQDKETVVFVNTGDVSNGKFLHHNKISKEGLPGQAKKAIKIGDILYSEIRPKNKRFAIVDFDSQDYVVSTKFMVLKRNDKIDLDFFYLFLKSNKTINAFQSHAEARSGTFPQITFDTISLDEINLPTLQEQKAIAKVLTAFDDKIELLQAQNKTLETMAQTIFKEWFGKYHIGDELPEGWRVGILDDLFGELATGNRPKGGVGNLLSGIPSIGAESIGGISNFDYSKTKYVSKEFFLKMKRGVVEEYDILIYKDGGTPGNFIPKFSIFGEGFPFKEFCINSHVFRVQPKKIHHRFYIYQWLNSYYCKWQLKNIGGKAAIPGINSTDLKNLDVIIPCDRLVYKYHDLVKNKYKKILKNMVHIQSLTKTRDTLMLKLMSGKIRVNYVKQTADA